MATLYYAAGAVTHAVAHYITRAELNNLEGREPPSLPINARLKSAHGEEGVTAVASVVQFELLRGLQIGPPKNGVHNILEQRSSGAVGRIVETLADGAVVICDTTFPFDTAGAVTLDRRAVGVPVTVGKVAPPETLPGARYVDLMVEGARAVGMAGDEVARLAATPCSPRQSAEKMRRFSFDPAVHSVYFRQGEVQGTMPPRFVFRGKVLERAPSQPRTWLDGRGKDVGAFVAGHFYDPLYGLPPEDPHEDWAGWAWIEDMAAETLGPCRHIGWLAYADKRAKL